MIRRVSTLAAFVLAMAAPQLAAAADLAPAPRGVVVAPGVSPCLGPQAPDLFCRHYGYRRGTMNYARCVGIIAANGPADAVSNGYTINFDWTKTLPPRICRPPQLIVPVPENRPL
jgi:hypothetical protein